jgi:hypothetical protein
LLGALPGAGLHALARHYTCCQCWFLDQDYKLPNVPKKISKDYCSLQNNNMNHGNVLLDCCVLVLVQLKGKEMFQKQKKIQAGRRNIKIEIKFQMMALLAY